MGRRTVGRADRAGNQKFDSCIGRIFRATGVGSCCGGGPEEPPVAVPVIRGLDTLSPETVKCWRCGMLGHYALDCPKETGADMQQSTTLNMLSTQESSQEHHTLIATLQNQVSLQQQLLSEQDTLASHDERLTNTLEHRGHYAAGSWFTPGPLCRRELARCWHCCLRSPLWHKRR